MADKPEPDNGNDFGDWTALADLAAAAVLLVVMKKTSCLAGARM